MFSNPWDIEPLIGPQHHGQQVSLVISTAVYQPGRHLCHSLIHQQPIMTDCILQRGHPVHTVLKGTIQFKEGRCWLCMTHETRCFPRQAPEMQGLYRIIDACSGISAVTKGYEACGAQVLCHVDSNRKFHEWTSKHGHAPSILGSVAELDTVHEVAKVVHQSHVLSAGTSCQPFSGLGDGLQGLDPRSASFTGILMMGFYLGSLAIILECTKEALTSEWIQSQLAAFSRQTGYQLSQTILHLHETWPAKRTRWWALLVHPVLAFVKIPPMPAMRFPPAIVHLLQTMLQMPPEHFEQLVLSKYEHRQFHDHKGGLGACAIDFFKALSTATHSWGSQVLACLCTCRQQGFSQRRLEEKGLYAVLIPVEGSEKIGNQEVQRMRHPHPQEVALLNGLKPSHVAPGQDTQLRLDLAGVGQLASPLQGAWVLSNLIRQIAQEGLHDTDINPRHVHAEMCRELLHERDIIWPCEGFTKSMKIFHQEVQSIDTPIVFLSPDEFMTDGQVDQATNAPGRNQVAPSEWEHTHGTPNASDASEAGSVGSPAITTTAAGSASEAGVTKSAAAGVQNIRAAASVQSQMRPSDLFVPADMTPVGPVPTSPDAMPLPRLGCGGPSRMDHVNSEKVPPTVLTQQQAKVKGTHKYAQPGAASEAEKAAAR